MEQRDYRAIILWEQRKGQTPEQIHKALHDVFGDNAPSYSAVKNWHQQFRLGRESTADAPRTGRPQEWDHNTLTTRISLLVAEDPRMSLRSLEAESKVPRATLHLFMHETLGMQKIATRWVPRMLNPVQKANRVACCTENRQLMQEVGPDFLPSVVTGDESWVHHYDPLSPRESREWVAMGEQASSTSRRARSAGKLLLCLFWDSKGILFREYLHPGETITGSRYAQQLGQLRQAIVKKRRGRITRGIRLLHDNAPAHTSNVAQAAIATCGFQLLNHPPYSPDVAPSDFHVFSDLKRHLRGKRFSTDNEVISFCDDYFSEKSENFWSDGIGALPGRWARVIDAHGDYFE